MLDQPSQVLNGPPSSPHPHPLCFVERHRVCPWNQGAGVDPGLADELVNQKRCYLPLDSPEFLCSDCSGLAYDFPVTQPPSPPGVRSATGPSRKPLAAFSVLVSSE